jgi:hypothetical protein
MMMMIRRRRRIIDVHALKNVVCLNDQPTKDE